ncbi:MAG: hypothetical protein P8X88_00010 [Gammaproteobacteria bacterium]
MLQTAYADALENRTIALKSNERFSFVQADSVTFKFQPLSEDARKLEITDEAAALGVAYLGQVKLKENNTTLSALRSIADQIGESLDISFGVIADSNTSEALKANELLLLYHPNVVITLSLIRPDENSEYEIICTYVLKEVIADSQDDIQQTISTPEQSSEFSNQIAPTEEALNKTTN